MSAPIVSPHGRDGHPGRYRDCQLEACRTYRLRYQKRWTYEHAQGRARTTADTRPVSAHIWTLLGAGWSARAIAGAASTSPSVVTRLRDQARGGVTTSVAARILAIDPSIVPSIASKQTTEPFVPRIGSVRRVQALLYMGWSHEEMRRRSGVRTGSVIHQQGRWVTRTTHDKLAALFDQLCMTQGGSSKAHTYAVQRGYAPPLAWDDIDVDESAADASVEVPTVDISSDVDEVAILRRMDGDKTVRLTKAERVVLAQRWAATGMSMAELERHAGIGKPERYHRINDDQEATA